MSNPVLNTQGFPLLLPTGSPAHSLEPCACCTDCPDPWASASVDVSSPEDCTDAIHLTLTDTSDIPSGWCHVVTTWVIKDQFDQAVPFNTISSEDNGRLVVASVSAEELCGAHASMISNINECDSSIGCFDTVDSDPFDITNCPCLRETCGGPIVYPASVTVTVDEQSCVREAGYNHSFGLWFGEIHEGMTTRVLNHNGGGDYSYEIEHTNPEFGATIKERWAFFWYGCHGAGPSQVTALAQIFTSGLSVELVNGVSVIFASCKCSGSHSDPDDESTECHTTGPFGGVSICCTLRGITISW